MCKYSVSKPKKERVSSTFANNIIILTELLRLLENNGLKVTLKTLGVIEHYFFGVHRRLRQIFFVNETTKSQRPYILQGSVHN